LRRIAAVALVALILPTCPAFAAVGMGTIEEPPEVIHAKLKAKAEQEYKGGMEALAKGDTARAVIFLLRVAKARIESPYPQ
jgi:hypothetical protein